jgi:hypothetical protein
VEKRLGKKACVEEKEFPMWIRLLLQVVYFYKGNVSEPTLVAERSRKLEPIGEMP